MSYPLRLKHAEHGYHYVYTPDEEARHRAIGWGDEDAAPQVNPERVSSPPATPDPAGAAPVKKRGRPRKVIQ